MDVLDRSVDPETGVVRTERILGCKQKAPSWVVKVRNYLRSSNETKIFSQFFGGSEDAYVREVSFVDPATQKCTITSVNLSLSQFATCYESIKYTPSMTHSKSETEFSQSAEIQARMAVWRMLSDKIELWLAERFEQNAQKGKLGFTDVLRSLWEKEDKAPVMR